MRNTCESFVEQKPEGNGNLRAPEVDGRIGPTFEKIRETLLFLYRQYNPLCVLSSSMALLCMLFGGFVNRFFPEIVTLTPLLSPHSGGPLTTLHVIPTL
jgi:hypothetical protein